MLSKLTVIQKIILLPLSLIYGAIIWIRNRLFDFNIISSKEYNIPIISVGNITVGGTGKTPLVEYLVELLQNEFSVATLSRGYKRKTKGFFLATENSSASEIGDEPCQIKQKYKNIAVAVDSNRKRGIEKLQKLITTLNVIILDDAFQHRYVKPGISILLVDYNRMIFEDFLLPAGRLREPASERDRADIIIVTKCPENIKPIELRLLEKRLKRYAYQRVFFTSLQYSNVFPVFSNNITSLSIEKIQDAQPEIIAISGIAQNKQFLEKIHELTSNTVHVFEFPDHYNYSAKDLHEIIELFINLKSKHRLIITTEKDATKIRSFNELDDEIKKNIYYLPVSVIFIEDGKEAFDTQIINYIRNNRPGNILQTSKINKKNTYC